MSFKSYIHRNTINESKVSQQDFIIAVNSYSSLDDALENLSDEYVEFYIKNINDKNLNKELKTLNLIENYDWEQNDYNVGMSPKVGKYKKIRYKGNYIVLKFDSILGWVPMVSFRSITQATKFIKNLYDEFN